MTFRIPHSSHSSPFRVKFACGSNGHSLAFTRGGVRSCIHQKKAPNTTNGTTHAPGIPNHFAIEVRSRVQAKPNTATESQPPQSVNRPVSVLRNAANGTSFRRFTVASLSPDSRRLDYTTFLVGRQFEREVCAGNGSPFMVLWRWGCPPLMLLRVREFLNHSPGSEECPYGRRDRLAYGMRST